MSGCVSQTTIDEQVARCPQFVQNNVGEIKYMPASWGTAMLISGVTDKHTGEIWLTAWADKHTILHEIGHSVYFRVPNEEFTKEFRKQDGFVSIWSIGIYEEIAEAFYEGMQGRSNPKINCAMKFFNGEFNKYITSGGVNDVEAISDDVCKKADSGYNTETVEKPKLPALNKI